MYVPWQGGEGMRADSYQKYQRHSRLLPATIAETQAVFSHTLRPASCTCHTSPVRCVEGSRANSR